MGKDVMVISLEKNKRSPWPAWLTAVLGMLWLGLFPLWHDGSYTRITRAKWLAMLFLTGVTAAAVASAVIILLFRRRRKLIRLHPAQALGLAYLGWVALSAVFGSMADRLNNQSQLAVIWGAVRYEGLLAQSCYVSLFLLMSLLPVRIRAVMRAAAAAVILYAGIVALQYADTNPFSLFPPGLNTLTTPEFQGTIGNIDMVSGWLCLVMPALLGAYALGCGGWLCLAGGCTGMLMQLMMEVQSGLIVTVATLAVLGLMFLLRPQSRSRILLIMGAAILLVGFRLLLGLPWYDGVSQLTFPHAPVWWKLLALGLGPGFMLLSLFVRKHPGRAIPGQWVAVAAGIGLAAVLAAIWFLPLPEGNGLWELQEILHGRAQDSFGSERLGVWRMTLDMSRSDLLFGTGPDTFYYALHTYMEQTGQRLVQTFDNPHNMLLAILSGSGLPALGLFLAMLAVTTRSALRASARETWMPALLLGSGGYLLQGLFTFSICLVSPMFWVMLGMTVSLTQEHIAEGDEQHGHEFRTAPEGP